MAIVEKTDVKDFFVDKEALAKLLDEQFMLMGIKYDPTVTAQDVYEEMLSLGIRPQDNILSRGIIEMREE